MNIKLTTILIASLFAFSSCDAVSDMLGFSSPTQPAVKPTPKKKVKKKISAAPVSAKVVKEEYKRPEYPNNTRRNPFQPNPEIILPVNTALTETRPKQPMEQFALSELDLVAIISSVAVPKAMFIDPSGFGHVLKEGERIGRNSGVISDIRDNEVDVREGGADDGQSRVVTMRLREVEMNTSSDDLSDDEKEALKKLMESEEGRKAVQRSFDDATLGASSVNKKNNNGTGVNNPVDNRFKGIRPPSSK